MCPYRSAQLWRQFYTAGVGWVKKDGKKKKKTVTQENWKLSLLVAGLVHTAIGILENIAFVYIQITFLCQGKAAFAKLLPEQRFSEIPFKCLHVDSRVCGLILFVWHLSVRCIYVVQHTRLNTTANVICFWMRPRQTSTLVWQLWKFGGSSGKNDERIFTDIPLTTCLLFWFFVLKKEVHAHVH